jgi:hypothetical protein
MKILTTLGPPFPGGAIVRPPLATIWQNAGIGNQAMPAGTRKQALSSKRCSSHNIVAVTWLVETASV